MARKKTVLCEWRPHSERNALEVLGVFRCGIPTSLRELESLDFALSDSDASRFTDVLRYGLSVVFRMGPRLPYTIKDKKRDKTEKRQKTRRQKKRQTGENDVIDSRTTYFPAADHVSAFFGERRWYPDASSTSLRSTARIHGQER